MGGIWLYCDTRPSWRRHAGCEGRSRPDGDRQDKCGARKIDKSKPHGTSTKRYRYAAKIASLRLQPMCCATKTLHYIKESGLMKLQWLPWLPWITNRNSIRDRRPHNVCSASVSVTQADMPRGPVRANSDQIPRLQRAKFMPRGPVLESALLLFSACLGVPNIIDNHVPDSFIAVLLERKVLSERRCRDYGKMFVLCNGEHLLFGQAT